MVALHNAWLEEQKPLTIRLIEARERHEAALREYNEAKKRYDKAASALEARAADVTVLLAALTEEAK